MGTEEAMTRSGKTKAPSSLPPPPPPALYLVRTWPRTSKVMGVDSPRCPSTPPLRSRVTVPFLWEDAPGKPKLPQTAHRAPLFFFPPAATASPALLSDHEGGGAVPLKLPPRLQTVAAAEYSVSSPRTVLRGPYFGGKKPPRPLRRSESTASRLLSWRKATASKKDGHDHDAAAAPDASCCSPPGSSASSSSSSSMSYFFDQFDDQSRRSHWRQQADAREESEDGGAQGSVRITRFRRNSSLPNITTSRLWSSVRKGVKQINPWS